MKRLAMSALMSLAASVFLAPCANATGWIVIDPVNGVMPTVPRPTPTTVPGRRPPIMPRVPGRTVLQGNVSFGLHLKDESIRVEISDQVAKTYISQTFSNDSDRNLAGTYLFPLPEDTTFSSFSLHIDGKPVEGKILEANAARQQYEEIVRRMIDPGLLEYADYKTVRARIFPIPAHGTKKVELEYTQLLKAENGMLKYRFPLKAEGDPEPVDQVKIDVKLSSKQGLRTIWSPTHMITANRDGNNLAKITMLEKETIPDKDFLLYYSVSDKDMAANLLTHKNPGEDGYFLLTLTPPMSAKAVQAKDIVLVADTSGSLSGEKMQQNKQALKYIVNALGAGDRFGLVQFNTDAEAFKTRLVEATAENKKAAMAFIDDLEAHGGTNIGDALNLGTNILNSDTSERPAYLVLMTDGEPTVGETDVNKLTKVNSKRDIRIFDFGVGYDVNTKLLNKLASEHHGTSQFIEPNESMETALSSFYNKIKSPVLSNVQIAFNGITVKDVYPREVKDIFAGNQVLLLGKYKVGTAASIGLTGKINGVAKSYTFPVNFSNEEASHSYLSRLWAMRRIGYLTDVAQANGDTKEVVDEIVALSKKYGIISQYTSYLVTDPSEDARLANNRPFPVTPRPMRGMPVSSAASPSLVAQRREARSGGAGGGARFMFAPNAPVAETSMDSFVGASRSGPIYGDEGSFSSAAPGSSSAVHGRMSHFKAAKSMHVTDSAPIVRDLRSAERKEVGQNAVAFAKVASKMKDVVALADAEKSGEEGLHVGATMKHVDDKTFYLVNGVWTDSSYDTKSPKAKVVTFGTDEYFGLFRSISGISKYLAVGPQVIVVFKGNVYKIVQPASAQG